MEYDQHFIDNYLRQKHLLTSEEIASFEAHVKENKALAEELRLQEDLILGINHFFDKELKEKLKEANPSTSLKVFSLNQNQTIAVAASLVLLIVAGFFLFKPSLSSEQLYLSYYQAYPNIVEPAERGQENIQDAYALYEKGDYAKAIEKFESQLANSQPTEKAPLHFYMAISAMELNDLPLAEENLLKVLEGEKGRFTNPARWYLALLYLRNNNTEKAEEELKILQGSNSSYAQKATDLFEAL